MCSQTPGLWHGELLWLATSSVHGAVRGMTRGSAGAAAPVFPDLSDAPPVNVRCVGGCGVPGGLSASVIADESVLSGWLPVMATAGEEMSPLLWAASGRYEVSARKRAQ